MLFCAELPSSQVTAFAVAILVKEIRRDAKSERTIWIAVRRLNIKAIFRWSGRP
jgi:hypothetical protein